VIPRKTRRPVVRTVRALDHGIGRLRGRRAVLFEARTPMNLAVLRPIFEPLLRDDRIEVLFTGGDRDDLRLAFEALGLSGKVISRRKASWTRVDLYVNADPWEAVTLRRVDKQLNFFHGVAGKYDLDCPTDLPLQFDRYDRVAFPNVGRLENYVSAGIVERSRAALIGYPKVDALTTDSGGPRAAASALGLDPSRPTAIFAPTFSPASALNVAGETIIETALASGCNVILKLHDRSLDPEPRYSGGIDWRARLARYLGPRCVMADSGDSTRYVLASDVMITDHSSIGFEFYILDRPLIVLHLPKLVETARISRQKVELLQSAALVAYDASEIGPAIRAALDAPGTLSAARRQVAAEVFYRPGGATDRALRLVYELLQLRPLPTVDMLRAPGTLGVVSARGSSGATE
jgi:hypothetical protein